MNQALEDLLQDLNKPFAIESISRKRLPQIAQSSARTIPRYLSPTKIQTRKRSEILNSQLDIQDILDIDTDDSDEIDIIVTKQVSNEQRRCSPVVIGRQHLPNNQKNQNRLKKSCNNLRCSKCDLSVLCFDNKAWTPNVDYLFLRNNYSMPDRLNAHLEENPEFDAYCCQCSWMTTNEEKELKNSSWYCAGHKECK